MADLRRAAAARAGVVARGQLEGGSAAESALRTRCCAACGGTDRPAVCPSCVAAVVAATARDGRPAQRERVAREQLEAALASAGAPGAAGLGAAAAEGWRTHEFKARRAALARRIESADARAAAARTAARRVAAATAERERELTEALEHLAAARAPGAKAARAERAAAERESLAEVTAALATRRRQLLEQLQRVLPLTAAKEDYGRGRAVGRAAGSLVAPVVVRLCGARLPDGPAALGALPPEELGTALGEAVRHAQLLAAYTGSPLLHDGTFRGSRSAVWQRDAHWHTGPPEDRGECVLWRPAADADADAAQAQAASDPHASVRDEASLKLLNAGAHLLARTVGSTCSLALCSAGVPPPQPPGWFPFVAAAALCSAWAAGEEPRTAATNAASAARVAASRRVSRRLGNASATGEGAHVSAADAAPCGYADEGLAIADNAGFGADSPESSAISSWIAENATRSPTRRREFDFGLSPSAEGWESVDRPEMPPPPSSSASEIDVYEALNAPSPDASLAHAHALRGGGSASPSASTRWRATLSGPEVRRRASLAAEALGGALGEAVRRGRLAATSTLGARS